MQRIAAALVFSILFFCAQSTSARPNHQIDKPNLRDLIHRVAEELENLAINLTQTFEQQEHKDAQEHQHLGPMISPIGDEEGEEGERQDQEQELGPMISPIG